jgi:hypothetical protein
MENINWDDFDLDAEYDTLNNMGFDRPVKAKMSFLINPNIKEWNYRFADAFIRANKKNKNKKLRFTNYKLEDERYYDTSLLRKVNFEMEGSKQLIEALIYEINEELLVAPGHELEIKFDKFFTQ